MSEYTKNRKKWEGGFTRIFNTCKISNVIKDPQMLQYQIDDRQKDRHDRQTLHWAQKSVTILKSVLKILKYFILEKCDKISREWKETMAQSMHFINYKHL